MTELPPTSEGEQQPDEPAPPPPPLSPMPSGDGVPSAGGASPGATADRPEIPIAAAFAGGLGLALILKRLAR